MLTQHPISEHCKFDILSSCLVAVTFYELVAAVDFLYGTAVISPYIPNNIQYNIYIYTYIYIVNIIQIYIYICI